jgi:endonuclease/exonuclease/phosphatase family metal-dependent hydrolase
MTRAARHSLRSVAVAGVLLLGCVLGNFSFAQTGTFVDRHSPDDLRVVSYNVLWDTIFPSYDPGQSAKFARVVQALDPDILNLQEIDFFGDQIVFTAEDVRVLMNSIQPLAGGASWYTHKGSDNVIVSKYPLSMQRTDTTPGTGRGLAIALVDLPNDQFATDFYFMNNHFKCCGLPGGSEDAQRQTHADALVNWMRDARTPGGSVTLPAGTPMAVVGDLNIVGLPDPLTNLKSGNVVNEAGYGGDSPPDWDGTALADLHPRHNYTGADYTWREDSSPFDPGRLDYILFTDSVVDVANHFILNTVAMTPAERTANGLLQNDVLKYSSGWYDHLPLVADFRFDERSPGDYNFDSVVNASDYTDWKRAYGSTAVAADGNGDGIVDAVDYTIWRNNLPPAPPGSGGLAAVPEPASYLLLGLACAPVTRCRRRLHFAGIKYSSHV